MLAAYLAFKHGRFVAEKIASRLRAIGWDDLADAADGDHVLATYWARALATWDPPDLVGALSLWTTRRELVEVACACVRLVVTVDPRLVRVLDVTERWADGSGAIEELWQAASDAGSIAFEERELAADAVAACAGSAGDDTRDDFYNRGEAINSAVVAVRYVVTIDGSPDRVRAVIARVAPPTIARLEAQSATWDIDH